MPNLLKKTPYLLIIIFFCNFLFLTIKVFNKQKVLKEEQNQINYYFHQNNNDNPKNIISKKSQKEPEITYYAVLEIPKINLRKGLVDPNSRENDVNKNIYIAKNSIFPNESQTSHLILAAHSGYDKIAYFKDLKKLSVNDFVYLYYNNIKYTYQIIKTFEIEKNGYFIYQNEEIDNMYLITCLKGTNKQIIYVANMINAA